MKKILYLIACFFPLILGALHERPWFDRALEINTSLTYAYQRFTKFDSWGTHFEKDSKDHFLQGNLWSSYAEYSAELEVMMAVTSERSFGLDHASQFFRYQLTNENIGDLLTTNVGLILSQVPTQALHDFTVLHHGNFEGELSYSFGKLYRVHTCWDHRFWGLGALGVGDHGSPWVRALFSIEKQWLIDQYFGFLVEWRRGFGTKNLFPHHFKGYGPVAYRFVDLKLLYNYTINPDSLLQLEYVIRLHAHNCPENLNRLQVTLQYAFGL